LQGQSQLSTQKESVKKEIVKGSLGSISVITIEADKLDK
jgi:hypothetical protein